MSDTQKTVIDDKKTVNGRDRSCEHDRTDLTCKKTLKELSDLLYQHAPLCCSSVSGQVQAGICVEDEANCIVRANERFCRMMNISVSPDDLAGVECARIVKQYKDQFLEPDAYIQRLNVILNARKKVVSEVVSTVDGRVFERDYFPLSCDGKIAGHLWVYRDVTVHDDAGKAFIGCDPLKSAIIKTAPDCIITIDDKGHILEFNAAAENTFGYTRSEVLGKSLIEIIVPQHFRDTDYGGLTRHLATGPGSMPANRFESIALRSDGSTFPAEVAVTSVEVQGRHFHTAFVRDISERRAQAAHHVFQANVLAQINDAVLVFDADLNIMYMNLAAEKLFEISIEDIRGKNLKEAIVFGWVADSDKDIAVEALSKKGSWQGENIVITDHGRIINTETEINRLESASDQQTVFVATLRDVTEKKKCENILYESKEQYRYLVEQAKDLIYQTNVTGYFTYANRGALTMIGYTREEIIGKHFLEVVRPDYRTKALTFYTRQVKRRIQDSFNEIPIITKDNREIWLGQTVQLIWEGDYVIGTQAIAHDITERRKAEELMRNAIQKERELGELKSRFVSMASHELRTPLATIQSSAELIERFHNKWPSEKTEKHFNRIRSNVLGMTELLENVLIFGKTDAGRLPFKPESLQIFPFCSDLVEDIRLGLGARHIIEFSCWDHKVEAEADPPLLRLMLGNVVTNAIKYSSEGSRVLLETEVKDTQIVFRVVDQGIGIPEEDRVRLFEAFYRAGNVGSRRGSGLGLSIVKQVVDLHKGTINVKSRLGKGTTFELVLPIQQSPACQ